jgi:hypothetical protein
MPAYLLLLAALLSRVLPHSGLFGFTAVGASLLYFGSKRSLREMILPVAALALVDYYLTTHVYSYEFHVQSYLVTWFWYAAAIVLGQILLKRDITVLRVASAVLLGPTSFFLISNYAVWSESHYAGGMYAANASGLITCLAAGLPFYGRDLLSTGLILTVAFGIPATIRHFNMTPDRETIRVRHQRP